MFTKCILWANILSCSVLGEKDRQTSLAHNCTFLAMGLKAATLEGKYPLSSKVYRVTHRQDHCEGDQGFRYKAHTHWALASKGHHNSHAMCIVNCLSGHFLRDAGSWPRDALLGSDCAHVPPYKGRAAVAGNSQPLIAQLRGEDRNPTTHPVPPSDYSETQLRLSRRPVQMQVVSLMWAMTRHQLALLSLALMAEPTAIRTGY